MPGTFENLEVWKLSMKLVVEIYRATRSFPDDERFGIVSQMRRAAVSIPSNIAEGKGRTTEKDCTVFLGHARGSQQELYTQVLIAKDLQYLSCDRAEKLLADLARIGRMLHGLINSTQRQQMV